MEILNKKINTNILENEIDEDFLDIYRFFKFSEKNKITEGNVLKIFKENNFLKKIFEDFIFIDKLYKLINELCNKYDKLNVNKYISNLSQFINNNYLKIGQNYKIRYALPDNGIKKIIDFLILLEKKNYNNDLKKEIQSKNVDKPYHNYYFDKFFKEFILTNEKLVVYTLQYLIEKIKNYVSETNKNKLKSIKNDINMNKIFSDFIELFFSFKYDFDNFINTNKQNIFGIFKNNKKIINIYFKFLNNSWKNIENTLSKFSFYKFSIELCSQIRNINILSKKKSFLSELNILLKKYLLAHILNWEIPLDYSELHRLVNENILPFVIILLQKEDTIEKNNLRINFFFDEFLPALNPDFKNKFEAYKNFILEYASRLNNKDLFNLDAKIINQIYLAIMLIFIKLKLGNYNPKVLIIYFSYLKQFDFTPIFTSFIKSYTDNNNKNDIPLHYFLSDMNLYDQNEYKLKRLSIHFLFKYKLSPVVYKDNIMKYFLVYLHKLKPISSSLIYLYIKNIFNEILKEEPKKEKKEEPEKAKKVEKKEEKKEKEKKGKKEKKEKIKPLKLKHIKSSYKTKKKKKLEVNDTIRKNEIIKYYIEFIKAISLKISKEQNKELYNIIIDFIFNKRIISFFSFLNYPCDEGVIIHIIHILEQISIDMKKRIKDIKEKDLAEYLCNKSDKITSYNLFQFLNVLRKQNKTLLSCIKDNNFLILYFFYILYINYYYYLKIEYNYVTNEFRSENKETIIIKNEINNFMNYYLNIQNELNKINKFDLSEAIPYLYNNRNIFFL